MSLNNLELSPALLAGLYSSSLIDTDQQEPVASIGPAIISIEKPSVPEWKSLGNNQQQILIVVDYANLGFLPDNDLNLLTNMLSACKLGLGDVAIINLQQYTGVEGKTITTHFKSKRVLLFGIDPISFGLPVNFPLFQVQAVANTVYLYSPALDTIIDDKLAKSKLWVCLQKVFGLENTKA